MPPTSCRLLTLLVALAMAEISLMEISENLEDNSKMEEDFSQKACAHCSYKILKLIQERNMSVAKFNIEDTISRCCEDAKDCWQQIEKSWRNASICPAIWDGHQCWPEQDADTIVHGHCPDYLYLDQDRSHCPRFSSRHCNPLKPEISKTDYGTCEILEFHRVLSNDDLQEPNELERRCCRTERRVALSWQAYLLDTCARCYKYLPLGLLSKDRFIYEKNTASLQDPSTNKSYWAIWTNLSHPIYRTFLSKNAAVKWRFCCQEALLCCHQHQYPNITLGPREFLTSAARCPATWDGWQCFPKTMAGSVSRVPCADHIYFKSEKPPCPKYSEKTCMADGRWYFDKKRGKEWTSYRPCGRLDDLRRQLLFHVAMYSITVIGIGPALTIFFIYKQLQVYRITMHKHFFFSLMLNGLCSLVFKSFVMLDELDGNAGSTILDFNSSWCKILFLLTKYFRLSNYMWMFCEGFYLHKLISSAFAEQTNVVTYYTIGWGFPLIPVAIYGTIRKIYYDEKCWVIPLEDVEWIFNGPSLLSLVINLIFLFRVIRILLTKLRAAHASEPSHYRKAVRAALVLVPLFGLHFLLVLYRPQTGSCQFLTSYVYFSHTLDGLQGIIVSLTLCYCNEEVLYLLRRTYQRYRLRHSISRQLTLNNSPAFRQSLSTQMTSMAEMHHLGKISHSQYPR